MTGRRRFDARWPGCAKGTTPFNSVCCAVLIATFAMAPLDMARAEDPATFALTLKDHRFTPTELHVPAGKPFFIVVTNEDDTADEFEMSRPAVEKVIPPGQQGKVRMRPLEPGRFPFFGDFHRETAQGVIVSE
jgi:heme/copper-type cytochrome/quinol oxidase subunit 2